MICISCLSEVYCGIFSNRPHNRGTMRRNYFLQLIPFCILAVMMVYTWATIITTDNAATIRHWLGLCFFLVNGFLYFRRFNTGIFGTGILLLLATFNGVALLPGISYFTITVHLGLPLTTPPMNEVSLLLLTVYTVVNFRFFIESYLDYKEKRGSL